MHWVSMKNLRTSAGVLKNGLHHNIQLRVWDSQKLNYDNNYYNDNIELRKKYYSLRREQVLLGLSQPKEEKEKNQSFIRALMVCFQMSFFIGKMFSNVIIRNGITFLKF